MKLMLFRVFLPSSFFLKQTAKCICPSSVDLTADGGESKAHYSFTHNICVGPCPKGTHYEEGKKDCVIDTADCDKATGQIPGKVGNVAEGHCVCPENEYMIEGKKCGICTDPKNHFVPYDAMDANDPIKVQKLFGRCECPLRLPHFSQKKKECYDCPKDVDGEIWLTNDEFADCEKKCPSTQVWIRVAGGSEFGYCGCEKPLTLVDNQCVNCNDIHKGTKFVEMKCVPEKFGSFQPCGECECPQPSVWSSTENQCITCDGKTPKFNPSTGKCEPDCGVYEETGLKLNSQGVCECDPPKNSAGETLKVVGGKCSIDCPPTRPFLDEETGQCKPISRKDCQCVKTVHTGSNYGFHTKPSKAYHNEGKLCIKGFFDGENQKCLDGPMTRVSYDNWAKQACVKYLSGIWTYPEAENAMFDITWMRSLNEAKVATFLTKNNDAEFPEGPDGFLIPPLGSWQVGQDFRFGTEQKCPGILKNSCPEQFKAIMFKNKPKNKPLSKSNPNWKPTYYDTPDCQNGVPKLYCPRLEIPNDADSVYVTYVKVDEFQAKNKQWFTIPAEKAQQLLKRVPVPPPIFWVRAIGEKKNKKIYRGSLQMICEREWVPKQKPGSW